MKNQLYRRGLSLRKQPDEAPTARLFVTVTEEVNGYAVWVEHCYDDDGDGPELSSWWRTRDEAIEEGVRCVSDHRNGAWQ